MSVCHDGLASSAEQPEPEAPEESFQTLSLQPRAVPLRWASEVPPTDVTYLEAAGYPTPYPLSPAAAVTATPGWLK